MEETSVYELRLKYPLNGSENQEEVHARLKNLTVFLKERGFLSVEITAAGLEKNQGDLHIVSFKSPLKY